MAHFWTIFPVFEAKKAFTKNLALSHTTSYEFPATCENFEKTNDLIPRKHPDGQKDRQVLFCRTLSATVGTPINIVDERLAE